MIKLHDLKRISKARLKDALVLYNNRRYDGSVYICGYAVETALKSRICKTLKWCEFPETSKEFENIKSLKTHNLDVLLLLSGIETRIKSDFFSDWSIVVQWDPEVRYKPVGSATKQDAMEIIQSTTNLLGVI